MRLRAGELATEWLGPRTDLEIQTRLKREVEQDRWTSLDRELKDRSKDRVDDLREVGQTPAELGHRARLLGRLQHLRALGVAREDRPGEWSLRPDAKDVLRAFGERGDIIRTMQRAFGKELRELLVFDPPDAAKPIVGRIAAKGSWMNSVTRATSSLTAWMAVAITLPCQSGSALTIYPLAAS